MEASRDVPLARGRLVETTSPANSQRQMNASVVLTMLRSEFLALHVCSR
jgi:hypothetical protein